MDKDLYTCPEDGTIDVYIKGRKKINRLLILIEANKKKEDKLFVQELKQSFHAKSPLNSALIKLTLHLDKITYINDFVGNMTQQITILNNTASENKATLFLNESNKFYRRFIIRILDGLLNSIDDLKTLKTKHLKHCNKKTNDKDK